MPLTTAPASTAAIALAESRYDLYLYESNLYDKDLHPLTGLPTPGIHTRVRPLIRAENFSLNLTLNRPGSASFEVPLQSDEAMAIAGYAIKRCIVIAVDGVPEWSGYIGNLSLTSGGNLSVSVQGWMQMLYGRELRQDLIFNTIDPGVIAARLLATGNNVVANDNTISPSTLVPNSSFERDAVGSPDPSWLANSTAVASKLVASGGAYKGTKFLRLTYSALSTTDDIGTGCYSFVSTPVAVGQQFSFRMAVRYSTPGKFIGIALSSDGTPAAVISGVVSTGDWQILQTPVMTAQAAATQIAVSAAVYGSISAGATMDIDDAYLIDVNSTTSGEDLLNGNGYFEGYLPSAADIASYGAPVVASDTWVRCGSRSLYVAKAPTKTTGYIPFGPPMSPAGVGVGGNIYGGNALAPVDPNTVYNVHAWINVVRANLSFGSRPSVAMYVNFFDVNKTFISGVIGTIYNTPGIYEVSDNFTSPSNAAYIAYYIQTSAGAEHKLEFYVDAVTSTKGTNPGIKNLPIRLGTVDSPAGPIKRTRTYRAGEILGNSIEELSNIESGFDWEVATVASDKTLAPVPGNVMSNSHTMLRQMNVKYTQVKAGTSIFGIGQDRQGVIFGLGREPETLVGLVEQQDISKIATRFTARGQGKAAMAQDIPSMLERGLWDGSANIPDAGISSNALLGYAGGEVAYRKQPMKTWQPAIKQVGGVGLALFWTNFRIGDIGYLSAEDGALYTAERQAIRLFGLTVGVDGNGNENLSGFQTTAGS